MDTWQPLQNVFNGKFWVSQINMNRLGAKPICFILFLWQIPGFSYAQPDFATMGHDKRRPRLHFWMPGPESMCHEKNTSRELLPMEIYDEIGNWDYKQHKVRESWLNHGTLMFSPTCQVRVVRFYVRSTPSPPRRPSPFLRRTSTASARSQWSPPGPNKPRIRVALAGPIAQLQARDRGGPRRTRTASPGSE